MLDHGLRQRIAQELFITSSRLPGLRFVGLGSLLGLGFVGLGFLGLGLGFWFLWLLGLGFLGRRVTDRGLDRWR